MAAEPFAQFPSFAPSFEPGALSVGAYLALLGPGDEAAGAVRIVADCLDAASNRRQQMASLLAPELGWRPQLVGCVAALAAEPAERPMDQLFAAAAEPSWVSPQLLATLSLVQPAGWNSRAERAIIARSDPKAAAALCELASTASAELTEIAAADVDSGGHIASRWREQIRRAFDDAGVPRSWK